MGPASQEISASNEIGKSEFDLFQKKLGQAPRLSREFCHFGTLLFETFLHDRKLQLGFRQRLQNHGLGGFR